jgi:hypothetical protein
MPARSSSRRETSRRSQIAARNRPLRGFATRGEANTPSEASAELRGVKKLFLQVVPVVSLYTLYTSTRLKPQALTRDHEPRRI